MRQSKRIEFWRDLQEGKEGKADGEMETSTPDSW